MNDWSDHFTSTTWKMNLASSLNPEFLTKQAEYFHGDKDEA